METGMDTGTWLLVAAVAVLIALSAFFSGSETSLTAISRARVHRMAQNGDRRALILQSLLAAPERLIGAILLGNNLVNILASALATTLFIKLFGATGVVWATLVMTALVLVFGEVMPKTYAIVNPDRFALVIAPAAQVVVRLFSPVVMLVQMLVRAALRLLGADPEKAREALSFREELRGAIDLHHARGEVVKKDRDMLDGVLDLGELDLADVMVHRTAMKSIDISRPARDILDYVLENGFTRYPVWRENPDNIIGVLHTRDLLAALAGAKGRIGAIDIEKLLLKPWFVPESTPVADQLSAFLRRKMHFAIIVDEYGELMGLVTLEDIMEEIVGDIADEHDREAPGVTREKSGSYIVEGAMPVRDLNRMYDWQLPEDEATTIAGLVIHEAQMIPEAGQVFTFHGFRFEVLERQKNRLTKIRMTPLDPGAGGGGAKAESAP
jgi:Mg2+/Co2+ transporter CorB